MKMSVRRYGPASAQKIAIPSRNGYDPAPVLIHWKRVRFTCSSTVCPTFARCPAWEVTISREKWNKRRRQGITKSDTKYPTGQPHQQPISLIGETSVPLPLWLIFPSDVFRIGNHMCVHKKPLHRCLFDLLGNICRPYTWISYKHGKVHIASTWGRRKGVSSIDRIDGIPLSVVPVVSEHTLFWNKQDRTA